MVEKADGTSAEDDGREAFDVARPAYGVQADCQGLGQRCGLERQVRRHPDALRRSCIKQAGEATLHMRGLRRGAHEIDVFAEVGAPFMAIDHRSHQRDGLTATRSPTASPVTLLPTPTISPASRGRDQRRGNDEIAGPGVAEIMRIQTADPTRAKPAPNHVGFEFAKFHIDDAQIFRAEESCSDAFGTHLTDPVCWQRKG